MQIYIIRHSPVMTDSSVCHGQYDFPIISEEMDKYTKIYKKNINFEEYQIISSPLRRCFEFSRCLSKNVNKVDDLKEFFYGDWEGKEWADIEHDKLDHWMKNYVKVGPPNGESLTNFYERIDKSLQEIIKKNKNTVIITHAGVMRAILLKSLNIPLEDFFKIQIGYGALIELEIDQNEVIKVKKFLADQ